MDVALVIKIIGIALGSWVGLFEWRLRSMDRELRKTVNRKEVEDLIQLKLESVHVQQSEMKEDIKDIKAKLDTILQYLIARNP